MYDALDQQTRQSSYIEIVYMECQKQRVELEFSRNRRFVSRTTVQGSDNVTPKSCLACF